MPDDVSKIGADRVWVYRNEVGEGVFGVGRWDTDGGKSIRPFRWTGSMWEFKSYDGLRPLLNLPEIVAHPQHKVLVVEGEKAVDAAGKYLPDGWVITTWAGGANAVKATNWEPLADRDVVIWPDMDDVGRGAAKEISRKLKRASVVNVPTSWPKGWDLADELPEGVSEECVVGMIDDALSALPEVSNSVLPEDVSTPARSHTFRALGYDETGYYVMPAERGVILKMNSRELMSPAGCLRLINDLTEWEVNFPGKKGQGAVDWTAAASMIMDKCHAAGIFDERRICGRGVWFEKPTKSVVVNTGDMFIVNGRISDPTKYRSSHIYKTCEAMLPDGFDPRDEATDAEGRLIVELCNTARWEREVYGDLLAGYIATSVVCGGLDWRTHVWVTGNSGSGKSTVVNEIAAACIGDIALYPLGETTEAGIRQMIGQDARPVIFDEMEGTDQSRGNFGDARRQAIVQLMRMSSTTGRGRIMKGGATHKATSFTMRSSFLVASIGVNLKEAPDLTRTVILSLRPLSPDASRAEKEVSDERWVRLNKLASRIPIDMPSKLLARQIRLLPVLRQNAQTFKEVIADTMANNRIGDQIGILLAGRCSLTSDKLMTYEECKEYVHRFDWENVVSTSSDREDRALIRHLRQTVSRIISDDGRFHDRTIGELVQNVLGVLHPIDTDVGSTRAHRHLKRLGLTVEPGRGVWIGRGIEEMSKIMRTSSNASDWWSVLSRYPDATAKRINFAGISTMAILIPEDEWYERD